MASFLCSKLLRYAKNRPFLKSNPEVFCPQPASLKEPVCRVRTCHQGPSQKTPSLGNAHWIFCRHPEKWGRTLFWGSPPRGHPPGPCEGTQLWFHSQPQELRVSPLQQEPGAAPRYKASAWEVFRPCGLQGWGETFTPQMPHPPPIHGSPAWLWLPRLMGF